MDSIKRPDRRKPFDVRDIVLAVTILALAAVLMPRWMHSQRERDRNQCESNEKNIGVALEVYSTDNSGRYPQSLGDLTPNYLRVIPSCPAVGSDTYSGTFSSASNPDAYTLVCNGHRSLAPQGLEYFSQQGIIIGH